MHGIIGRMPTLWYGWLENTGIGKKFLRPWDGWTHERGYEDT